MRIVTKIHERVTLPPDLEDAATHLVSGGSSVDVIEARDIFGRRRTFGIYTGAENWFELNPFRECSSVESRRLFGLVADHTRAEMQRDAREKQLAHEAQQLHLRMRVFAPWIDEA